MGSTFYVSGTFFPGTGTGGIARDGCPSLNFRPLSGKPSAWQEIGHARRDRHSCLFGGIPVTTWP